MSVELMTVLVSIVAALGYAFYGIARAKAQGLSIDYEKLPATFIAAVFIAIVAPELIPSAPEDVFTLPAVALTAFSVYGAIFVFQRLYDVGVAVLAVLKDKLASSNFSQSMQPKVRKRAIKAKPKAEAKPA